jgi:hypothetical protein
MGAIFGFAASHAKKVPAQANQPPPPFVGWIFGAIGLAVFVLLLLLAGLKLKAAFCIKRRESRTFCVVIAGLTCVGFPYGTALGVFTFIVLGRDSVLHMFEPPLATTAHTSPL